MQKLYIIAGCNGAGKTTASYTILPDMLRCNEFVNADEIARGLSPFNPESMAIEAGRLMLRRMNDLLNEGADFAFETTLSTRTYSKFVDRGSRSGLLRVVALFLAPDTQTSRRACCQTCQRRRSSQHTGQRRLSSLRQQPAQPHVALHADMRLLGHIRQQYSRGCQKNRIRYAR